LKVIALPTSLWIWSATHGQMIRTREGYGWTPRKTCFKVPIRMPFCLRKPLAPGAAPQAPGRYRRVDSETRLRGEGKGYSGKGGYPFKPGQFHDFSDLAQQRILQRGPVSAGSSPSYPKPEPIRRTC